MSTNATHDGYEITVLERPDGWSWDIFTEDGCFIRQPEDRLSRRRLRDRRRRHGEGLRVARWLSETRL